MEEKLNDLMKDNKQLEKVVDELNEVSLNDDNDDDDGNVTSIKRLLIYPLRNSITRE